MKEITRKQFMGGMAATVALGWRGTFAAPMRRQRNYLDMTWWDPYVENITDTDTYLRRKFRQDVTDKTTGVGVEALKKILAEIVASGKAGARFRLLAAEAHLSTRHPGAGRLQAVPKGKTTMTGAGASARRRFAASRAVRLHARQEADDAGGIFGDPIIAFILKGFGIVREQAPDTDVLAGSAESRIDI